MQPNNAFSIGIAPALLGPGAAVERFGSQEALMAYVRATMPRPFPGALENAEYANIVAFLLAAQRNLDD